MDYNKEYLNTSDKVAYFQSLTEQEKKLLYQSLATSNQKELLSILPLSYLKAFIAIYPKEEQQNLYKNLSDTQLIALYRSSSTIGKQEMIEILEQRQITLNERIEESRKNIQDATTKITEAHQSIETSTINIANNRLNLKEQHQNLKQNKVILKKLTNERKKQLKKVIRAQSRASSSKLTNRIGIISKYRTKKYLEKIEQFQEKDQMVIEQRHKNAQITSQINEIKQTITKEQDNIVNQQNHIKNAKHTLNYNISAIGRTEAKITSLSKSEKKLLGRKLYHQTIAKRDCIMVRKKKQIHTASELLEQTPAQSATIKEEPLKSQEPIVEVVNSSKANTEQQVNNIMNNVEQLHEMGVNFYPPSIPNNQVQSANFLEKPIMQMSQEQLILASYTMMAVYNYALKQMLKQTQLENQNLTNGRSRTLAPENRGVVSLTLLISIILFIFSLFLFFIK